MVSGLTVGLLLLLPAVLAAPVQRSLPAPISAASARTALASRKFLITRFTPFLTMFLSVTVSAEVNTPAYDRDLFKTWDIISGTCDTRESTIPISAR